MNGQWAVIPDIRPWRGDQARDWTPYYFSGGISWACLHSAQFAAGKLRKIGIPCYVDMVLDTGGNLYAK